ncbi:response regulator [Thiohalocapsa marina]|nr:response regulator [Thiohalocapsa marina]
MTAIESARILIVDDAPSNIELLLGLLKRHYDVSCATSGRQALDLIARHAPPDLILLDVMMPEMDGYQVCAALKDDPATEAIPVIFITAKTDAESETRALAAGAMDFIHKPVNPAVLLARVSLQLELAGHRREQRERLQAETAARRENEQRLGAWLEQGLTGVAEMDLEFRLTRVNDRFCAIVGKPREALLGRRVAEFSLDEDWQREQVQLEQLRADGRQVMIDKTYPHPDGRLRHVNHVISLLHDADGAPMGFLALLIDITERKETEVELRMSEERLQLTVDGAGIGIWDWDLVSDAPVWSDLCKQHLALPAGQAPSIKHFHRVLHPDDRARVEALIRHCAESGEDYNTEYRILGADGAEHWISAVGRVYRDAAGKPERLRGITRDITTRKQAELNLQESERRFRELFEHLPIAYQSVDSEGRWLDANQKMADLLGFDSPQQMLGLSFVDYWDPSIRDQFDGNFACFKASLSANGEVTLRRRDGTAITVIFAGRIHRDAQGRFLRTHCILVDISERRALEEEVRALNTELEQRVETRTAELTAARAELERTLAQTALSETRYRLAIEATKAALWDVDFTTGEQVVSDSWYWQLGYAVGEVEPSYARWRTHLHPDDLPRLDQATERFMQGPSAGFELDYRVLTKPGAVRWHHGIGEVVSRDANGRALRMIGTTTDITRQREQEQGLRAAKAKAEAADAAKGAFVANMSHEVRTPMNAVLGFLDILLDTRLDAEQRGLVRKVKGSAQALLRILNDILDFSKLDAGKVELESAPFRLDRVLQQVAELFALAAAEKDLELVIDAPPALAGGYRGDALRLSQILNNLVGNAIKFSDRGSVEIVVRAAAAPVAPAEKTKHAESSEQSELTDCRWLRIEVRDRGIGLTPEQAAGLFQPFTQADASITRRFGGSGLGLTISKRLVEIMGGVIGVESTEGAGSTFWLELPLMRDGTAAEARSGDLRPGRVLVVDDQASVREVLGRYLSTWGFRVDTAADADSGLARLLAAAEDAEPVSLLILDWKMPRHDGLWLLEQLQGALAEDRLRRIPIVLMVTAFERQALQKAAARGPLQPDLVLSKPLSQSLLYEAIADLQQHGYVRRPTAEVGTLDPYTRARRIRGAELLLVEDNLTNQEVALAVLRKLGLQVSVANNGQEALEQLKQRRVDLVLMDLQMPVMDGFEATAAIRAADWGTDRGAGWAQDLPIIAMTAAAFPEDCARARAAGMNDYVSKPIDLQQLVSALLRWLPVRAEASAAAPGSEPVPEPEPVTPSATAPEAAAGETQAAKIQLDGFDLQTTRQRLDDDEGLLQVILDSFLREFQDWPATLAAARAEADTKTAVRLAHTLKGAAANVGATQVQAAAAALEAALKEAAEPAQVETRLADCLAALEAARAALQAYLPAPAPFDAAADTACDLAAARADLAELEPLLSGHRLVRDALLERLRSHLGEHAAAELEQLCAQIQAFDFKAALATLGEIQRTLER